MGAERPVTGGGHWGVVVSSCSNWSWGNGGGVGSAWGEGSAHCRPVESVVCGGYGAGSESSVHSAGYWGGEGWVDVGGVGSSWGGDCSGVSEAVAVSGAAVHCFFILCVWYYTLRCVTV
jgi:hypothetical protein